MAVNLSFIGGAGWQFLDNSGNPLSGGKIYTYSAGTTTPQTTYTSRTGLVANTNPIILDAAGRTPEQIWSTEGVLYKYMVADSNDVVIRTWDNIGGSVVASNLAQDLANTTDNAKGDALVGFKQSNSSGFLSGAVGRTVNTKLSEFVSIQDFGGVGDATADDTAAVLAAIAAVPEYGTILLNNGIFKITQNIHITKSINIIGTGVNSGFYLDLDTSTDGIRYGNVEAFSGTLSLMHSVWQDFGIYGAANSCKNALVLTGLIQCSFVNIHVMAGSNASGYGVRMSYLQSCRPVQFNTNQFYPKYPVTCTIPANGFRGAKLDGTDTALIDCEFNLVADGGLGYGIYMQGMQSSVLSGLSEGNSTYQLALKNCLFNNIRNFYVESTPGGPIQIIDDTGRNNVYGPGIFHAGNQVTIQLQSCDGCVIDGNTVNRIYIDSGTINTKLGNNSCYGQTNSNVIDLGANTTQLNANAQGYQNVNNTGQLSDFSSIIFNGSLDRWIDATTPAGSWSSVAATMTRETSIVKQGVSSVLCVLTNAYPASQIRLSVPISTATFGSNRATATGWIYIPSSGGNDININLFYNAGAAVVGAETITTRNAWKKVTFSFDLNYTGVYSSVNINFSSATGSTSFYLDGWSITFGNAGGSSLFTPNAYEFVRYTGQEAWNPGTINDGAQVANDFTVLGATLGMAASAGAGVDVQDCLVSATVTAADTVTVVIRNNTGGNVTLGNSTWYVAATNITV